MIRFAGLLAYYLFVLLVTYVKGSVKKKGPVAFFLSTLRNIICAVLSCCEHRPVGIPFRDFFVSSRRKSIFGTSFILYSVKDLFLSARRRFYSGVDVLRSSSNSNLLQQVMLELKSLRLHYTRLFPDPRFLLFVLQNIFGYKNAVECLLQ